MSSRRVLALLAILLFFVSPTGSGQAQGVNELPAWSPDGGRIAFHSSREGNGIWVMDADGGNQRPLTTNPRGDSFPTWAPDGSKIAFARMDGSLQVYVMNADGSGVTRLTTTGENFEPDWSPHGRTIAFNSHRDGNREIYVMNPDGGGQTNLTSSPGLDTGPEWSPDGRRIAFSSDRDGDFDIYVMDADGGGVTQLTNDPASLEVGPSWSPDGSQLAFTLEIPMLFMNLRQLFIVNADGSGRRRLTQTTTLADEADWSPDGSSIAFELGWPQGEGSDIYTVAPDGSQLRNLTRTAPSPQPPQCLIPYVRGKPLAAARRAITAARCTVGSIRRVYSAKVKPGRVVSQTPGAGAVRPNRTKVNLVVSRGPKR